MAATMTELEKGPEEITTGKLFAPNVEIPKEDPEQLAVRDLKTLLGGSSGNLEGALQKWAAGDTPTNNGFEKMFQNAGKDAHEFPLQSQFPSEVPQSPSPTITAQSKPEENVLPVMPGVFQNATEPKISPQPPVQEIPPVKNVLYVDRDRAGAEGKIEEDNVTEKLGQKADSESRLDSQATVAVTLPAFEQSQSTVQPPDKDAAVVSTDKESAPNLLPDATPVTPEETAEAPAPQSLVDKTSDVIQGGNIVALPAAPSADSEEIASVGVDQPKELKELIREDKQGAVAERMALDKRFEEIKAELETDWLKANRGKSLTSEEGSNFLTKELINSAKLEFKKRYPLDGELYELKELAQKKAEEAIHSKQGSVSSSLPNEEREQFRLGEETKVYKEFVLKHRQDIDDTYANNDPKLKTALNDVREEDERARLEKEAQIKAEQEAKQKAEEEARIKAEQERALVEEKEKAEAEAARIAAEEREAAERAKQAVQAVPPPVAPVLEMPQVVAPANKSDMAGGLVVPKEDLAGSEPIAVNSIQQDRRYYEQADNMINSAKVYKPDDHFKHEDKITVPESIGNNPLYQEIVRVVAAESQESGKYLQPLNLTREALVRFLKEQDLKDGLADQVFGDRLNNIPEGLRNKIKDLIKNDALFHEALKKYNDPNASDMIIDEVRKRIIKEENDGNTEVSKLWTITMMQLAPVLKFSFPQEAVPASSQS